MNVNDLQQFKCHKVVRAARIDAVHGDVLDLVVNKEIVVVDVGADWIARQKPEPGGFFVVYADGYRSYSTPEAFVAGYHAMPLRGSACGANSAPVFVNKTAQVPLSHDVQELLVTIPLSTLKYWRELVDLNPIDLAPRIERYLNVDPIDLTAADFSDALIWLKEGNRVQRAGWNGKGQFVQMEEFPANDFGSLGVPLQACFVLKNAQGFRVPGWVPSLGDLMATDWQVVTD